MARFGKRIQCNPRLDRTLVSFQANRESPILKWFKYKEGFSRRLVEYILSESKLKPGILLDPFAGTGTSMFVAKRYGWEATGIELLPVGCEVISAHQAAMRIKPAEFSQHVRSMSDIDWESLTDPRYAVQHINITRGAFSPSTERAIAGYRAYCHERIKLPEMRKLLDFACFAVLEEVSYTRKDGQYLRWDSRTPSRAIKTEFDKGKIPSFATAIRRKLETMRDDLSRRQETLFDDCSMVGLGAAGEVDLRKGSTLEILPELDDETIDLVITSPPYCNRYDYTRTYALELVFLGCSGDEVKQLRQRMLSCTVENQEKESELKSSYAKRRRSADFQRVVGVFDGQDGLHEVLLYLDALGRCGALNNSNIPRMVRNYFLEMCFVVYELARVLRPGGRVFMVNDNVQYAGEELPVDLILSAMAEGFGLKAKRIWTLPRGKGNSSQQMGSHGRQELRKCVYVWEKPAGGTR